MHAGTKIKPLKQGFSLVEILTVVSILTLLIGLTATMSNSVVTSVDVSATAERVIGAFNRAREEAITRNENVQMRIYRPDDVYNEIGLGVLVAPDDPNDPNYNDPSSFTFRRLQPNIKLPLSVSIIEGRYSTLLGGSDGSGDDSNLSVIEGTEIINEDEALQYSAFSFRSNNRVRLATDTIWTLTLGEADESVDTPATELPDNFLTIQLNPNTARAFVIRP